jgi:flagellar basal-body rod modification protein FlgD
MANTLSINSSTKVSTTDPFAPRTNTSDTATTQVTKNMFLQLLVAQIKNQDPMSPSDGVQFLSQLAQFQQLENGMNMGQDISAIRSSIEGLSTTGTTGK